jgi:hypothetical protein
MPKPTPDTLYQLQFASDAVSFDAAKFDEFIRSNGVTLLHWRAMRCPVGMTDPDDIRRPHDHHENCSNGMVYTLAGKVTVGFMNNSSDLRFIDAGRLDGSTVTVVLPRFYDDKPEVRVEIDSFDRMYLPLDDSQDVTVTTKQTFAANASGVDKLHFPIVRVQELMDADGKRYVDGVDFEVRDGQIRWGSRRPGLDAKLQKGKVCSARYSYRPYWYVKSLIHEVRLATVTDEFTMERRTEQMPQAAVLQREFFFEKEQRDQQAPPASNPPVAAQQSAPGDGIFGPR